MTAKAKAPETATAERADSEPSFTKAQLVGAKHFGYPRDAVAAVLKDGETYTMDRAKGLVSDFLKGRVK